MQNKRNVLTEQDSLVLRKKDDDQSLMRREMESWLVGQCGEALDHNGGWKLDFGSAEAYDESCRAYRQSWSETVGEFSFDADFNATLEPYFEDEKFIARQLCIDLADGLQGRAVLALPKQQNGPLPLVIAQHGITSGPETVFGFADPAGRYHSYAMELLNAGYAVLAPSNISQAHPRARLHRLCLLLGKTLAGLEVGKIRRLLDYVLPLPEIDEMRVGMWGISLGGLYTLFTTPLEPRIKAAIVCAFFNDRHSKMAVSSPMYSCFVDVDEEHIWIPGWFRGGFGDAQLLALMCPRPVQIQQGRADGIGWWPQQHEEFDRAKDYYDKLGMTDRAEYCDHNGGHEILAGQGLDFMNKWL